MADDITSTKNRIGRNRGWFFRKLGSKKEGGSQQIEYKLPNLHSRVEPLQRRTLSKKSQEKCYLRAMLGLAWFQFTRKSREVSDKSEVVGDLLGNVREVFGLRDTAVDSRARILSYVDV